MRQKDSRSQRIVACGKSTTLTVAMTQPPISILKSLWARTRTREWAVSDLKELKLAPKHGCSSDYFSIDSKFELMTNNASGMSLHQVFSSFGSTEFLLRQSIVPVVAWCEGDDFIRTVGTASLISCTGYVLTAAHVLLDPFEAGYGAHRSGDGIEYEDTLNFGVIIPIRNLPGPIGAIFAPFSKLWCWGRWRDSPLIHESSRFEPTTDIAICKIPELPCDGAHQPLAMSLNPFQRNEWAYSIGYAEMAPIPLIYKNDRPRIGDFSASLYVSVGRVNDLYPLNHIEREVPTPGPCFDFLAKVPGKMSGAPIFGGGGAVIRGVVSRSFQDERHAFGSMLGPAMDLPIDEPNAVGRTLRSLMEAGTEGIARITGVGL